MPTYCGRCQRAVYRVQPTVQVFSQGKVLGIEDQTRITFSDSLGQLSGYFFPGLPIDVPAFAVDLVLTNPPTIFAAINAPLALATSTFSHEQPPLAVNGLSIRMGEERGNAMNPEF